VDQVLVNDASRDEEHEHEHDADVSSSEGDKI